MNFLNSLTPLTKWLGGILILIALLTLSYCTGRHDGKNSVELANQKAINAAVVQDRQSAERRQQEELASAIKNEKVKAAYDTAIATAPGGINSPSAHALACERLRQAYGAGSANLPASCRPASGH